MKKCIDWRSDKHAQALFSWRLARLYLAAYWAFLGSPGERRANLQEILGPFANDLLPISLAYLLANR